MRAVLPLIIFILMVCSACTNERDVDSGTVGDGRVEADLRDISELMEKRTSPPYFQLKAGCKLPEMSFDDGWRQLKVMAALAEKDLSKIVLNSEQNDGKYGRLGFWEDHTTPESDKVKSLKALFLRERNMSLIDNRAVREIADMHCNKGSAYGAIISNIRPNLGPTPERMKLKIITTGPNRPVAIPEPEKGQPKSLFPTSNEARLDVLRFGLISCFESNRLRNMLVVDADSLRPWLDPKDAAICEPINWDDFKDNIVETIIE